jgi:hypothetical protein
LVIATAVLPLAVTNPLLLAQTKLLVTVQSAVIAHHSRHAPTSLLPPAVISRLHHEATNLTLRALTNLLGIVALHHAAKSLLETNHVRTATTLMRVSLLLAQHVTLHHAQPRLQANRSRHEVTVQHVQAQHAPAHLVLSQLPVAALTLTAVVVKTRQ